MNKITIILRQPLERLPPIISLIDCLIDLEYSVNIICEETSSNLIDKYSTEVKFWVVKPFKANIPVIGKIVNWFSYRKKVFNLLNRNPELYSKDVILWIGSADAAIALNLNNDLKNYKYVFQCHELYDAFPFYMKRLKAVMQNACVNVGPEISRNAIYRSLYNLEETPQLLPNKPYIHPKKRNLTIEDPKAAEIIEKIRDRKILLYQGGIVKERDVTIIASAIRSISDEWVLVLMGNTDNSDYLKNLLEKYPETIHIPPVKAPNHLQVTSWARIGLVSYTFCDLNHIFCAPNKTWEYTGFGIPLLGNVVPGLMNDINHFRSGLVVNLDSKQEYMITDAIKKIDSSYDLYSKNAKTFYDSVDLRTNVTEIMSFINQKY